MSTPIKIEAQKLEIPFVLSQFEKKKLEIAALVESLDLIFEGEQNLYDVLLDLGIDTVAEGENYDSIDVTKGAGVAPVSIKLTEHPQVGLSVDTSEGTAIVAIEAVSSLGVTVEPANDIDVQTKQQLSVSVVNPNEYVNTQPDRTLVLTSENGTKFLVAVGNDGTLAAIPPTSTAPSITTLPTISGTLNVGETLTATAGNVSGDPTPTRVLQWQRSDNGTTGWADISGATGTTYLLGSLDEDKYIRVAQTEENILGTATANSASTGQIQPAAFSGLLDDYPNAAAAYSLRKLRVLYSGDAIVVRRASDNATQSIGFDALTNELDTASLESFCAGTDGFVTTWYDQSGNGYDAAQTTAGSQPKIVSSGSTILENGKAAVQFDGGSDQLTSTFGTTYNQPTYSFLTHNFTSAPSAFDGLIGSIGTEHRLIMDASLLYTLQAGGALRYNQYSTNQSLVSYKMQASDPKLFFNGTQQLVSAGTQIGTSGLQGVILGGITSGSGGGNTPAQIQELVIYGSDQDSNRTDIETNINDFYTIC